MTKKQFQLGELERILSEQIINLYNSKLEHQLSEISYKWFDDNLIIIMEGTVTQPEKLLNDSSQKKLAQKVRAVFDKIIQPQIKILIEEVFNVTVVDFLTDTTIDTGRTGAIAIFELQPKNFPTVNSKPDYNKSSSG